MERRQQKRQIRRILVHFTIEGNPKRHMGYTTNLSLMGMFVASTATPPQGTRVVVEFPNGEAKGSIEARVIRVKLVPIELRRVNQAGFGLRFTGSTDAIRGLLPDEDQTAPDAVSAVPVVRMAFENGVRLREVYDREICAGTLLVPMSGPAQVGDFVIVDLIPPPSLGTSVRCAARVKALRRGAMIVELEDLEEIQDDLAPLLDKITQPG